jgi:mannosyltransferase OCH1-like enzyme
MIPKRIISIWLGDKQPELIQKCLNTHYQPGFENLLITLDNCYRNIYIEGCLQVSYAKAADYLRIYYLNKLGGIYLDADVEVIKPLDDFLDQEMFTCVEENGFVSNAIIGSVPGHPILKDYLGKVDRNFIGNGDLIFQPGMFLWTEIVKYNPGVRIYPPEYFLPYNHRMDRMKITENTHTIHYFLKSWTRHTYE